MIEEAAFNHPTKLPSPPPPRGHTVTITSQNENYANISGTTGLILLIFLVQNPYKFAKLL